MPTSPFFLPRYLRISCWCSLCFGLLCFARAADDTPFVSGLSASERASIGLDDLTPQQRAALEQAVERYVTGRSEVLVAEAATAAATVARSELVEEINQQEQKRQEAESALAAAQAELAAKEKEAEAAQQRETDAAEANDRSLLERAAVLLTPGTKIEFATVNSTLINEFKGWNVGTLFRLENGQVWRVSSGKYWAPREAAGKVVSIEPGSFGSFHMRFEGIKPTPKVELVSRN